MKILFIACFLLGSLVVFQPAFNRLILEHKGLSFAVLFNSIVGLSCGALLFALTSAGDKWPDVLHLKSHGPFHWWFVLPGIFGFLLVVFVPLMIRTLGAFPTVVSMLLGQVVTSFLWDTMAIQQPIKAARVAGLVLAMAGAYLSFKPGA